MAHVRHANRDELVQQFRNSGKTQKEWCNETGVNIHNLQYWLSRRQKEDKPSFESWMHLKLEEDNKIDEKNAVNPITAKIGNVEFSFSETIDPVKLLGMLRMAAQI